MPQIAHAWLVPAALYHVAMADRLLRSGDAESLPDWVTPGRLAEDRSNLGLEMWLGDRIVRPLFDEAATAVAQMPSSQNLASAIEHSQQARALVGRLATQPTSDIRSTTQMSYAAAALRPLNSAIRTMSGIAAATDAASRIELVNMARAQLVNATRPLGWE